MFSKACFLGLDPITPVIRRAELMWPRLRAECVQRRVWVRNRRCLRSLSIGENHAGGTVMRAVAGNRHDMGEMSEVLTYIVGTEMSAASFMRRPNAASYEEREARSECVRFAKYFLHAPARLSHERAAAR